MYATNQQLAAELRAWRETGEPSEVMIGYVDQIVKGCAGRLHRGQDVDDILSLTWIRLIEKLETIDPDSNVFSYITGMARYAAFDLTPRGKRAVPPSPIEDCELPDTRRTISPPSKEKAKPLPDGVVKKGRHYRITVGGQTKYLHQWCAIYGVSPAAATERIAKGEHPFVAMSRKPHKYYATLDGETMMVSDWCERLGLNYHTIKRRIQNGMSPEEALAKPLKRARLVEIDGRSQTIPEWCSELGINHGTIRVRMNRGMSAVEALTTPLHCHD